MAGPLGRRHPPWMQECRLACWRAGWGFIRTDDVRMLYYQRLEPGKFWTQEKCLRGPFRKPTVAPAMGWCTYTFAKSATVSRTHVRINAVPSSPMSLPLRSSLASDEHSPSTPARLRAPASPMPLYPRSSVASDEHCPSTPARLPAPSAPMLLYPGYRVLAVFLGDDAYYYGF